MNVKLVTDGGDIHREIRCLWELNSRVFSNIHPIFIPMREHTRVLEFWIEGRQVPIEALPHTVGAGQCFEFKRGALEVRCL